MVEMKKLFALCVAAALFVAGAQVQAQVALSSAFPVVAAWTPALTFGGGDTGMSGTVTGRYTQYGKLVVAEFVIALVAVGSSTGAATITGLPLPADVNLAGTAQIVYYSGMSGMSAPINYVANNSSTITLNLAGAAGLTAMTNSNFTNSSNIYGIAIYMAQ